jgi:predicted O-methyltransferase YrrM
MGLASPRVRETLDRIWAMQDQVNPAGEARLKAAMADREKPFTVRELVELCAPGSFAAPPAIGRLLYAMVRAIRPDTVVEFGSGHGFSTIHIAAALRDNGHGRLVSTELHPDKARAARDNLVTARLADWAEILEGDAIELLGGIADVDMLYLDGWTEFYLPVLAVVEPNLRPGALVHADDVGKFGRGAAPYLEYVRSPASGYVSVTLTDYQGFELSAWTGRSAD